MNQLSFYHKIYSSIPNGSQASIHLLEHSLTGEKIVAKSFHYSHDYFHELNILQKLSKYSYFPKIIMHDDNEYILYLSYCGETLLKQSDNPDIRQQIWQILDILQREQIYHNDMCLTNFLVDDKNHVYLIDFARASMKKEGLPYKNLRKKDIVQHKHLLNIILHNNYKLYIALFTLFLGMWFVIKFISSCLGK